MSTPATAAKARGSGRLDAAEQESHKAGGIGRRDETSRPGSPTELGLDVDVAVRGSTYMLRPDHNGKRSSKRQSAERHPHALVQHIPERGPLVLRIIVAIIFLHAGIAKWFLWSIEPMEGLPVWLHYVTLFLSIAEPIGAVALVAGFLTRAAAACLAIIMIGSIPISHILMGVPFFTAPQLPGWDANLMILGGCLALAAFGAGAWSVDALRRKQSLRPATAHGTPGSISSGTSA